MKRKMTNANVINWVLWFNQLPKERLDLFNIKLKWAIKKAYTQFLPVSQNFEELRDQEYKNINEKYFNDEKSVVTTIEEKDSDGNPISKQGRKVKDEYMDEYKIAFDELNTKLIEILKAESEYTLDAVDIDSYIGSLPDDTQLSYEDIDMISIFEMEE